MMNRTMASLMALLPGARDLSGGTSAHGTSPNYISVGGGANYNMLVDGIDNKEDHCGGTEIVYSLDGIQEFKLMAAGSSAEYGKGTEHHLPARVSGRHGAGDRLLEPSRKVRDAESEHQPADQRCAAVGGRPSAGVWRFEALSVVNIMSPVDEWQYDEVATHFERRFSAKTSITVNYTLAWARGMGGVSDGTTHSAPSAPQLASPTGGDIYAPWEWGYTGTGERHRVTLDGNLTLPFQIDVSPSMTAATPRAYTQTRGTNPSGDGSLQLLCPSGDSDNVGFGVGQMPCGIGNVRGFALFNVNARLTKYLSIGNDKLGLFAEFYNLTNRTDFGTSIGSAQNNPATYGKPTGYAGGTQATSTIPNSRQMQFGMRYSF